MLTITILTEPEEQYDEETNRFISGGDPIVVAVIEMEHSLASLSKWESIHQIPFLSSTDLPPEQVFDYLKCMVVSPDVDPDVLYRASQSNLEAIQAYINSSESATTFGNIPNRAGGPRERVTSELIYYWMAAFQIPIEAEHWHLNRLLSLIKIFSVKNAKQPKRSAREMAEERNRINAERRAKLGTSG